VFEVGLVGNPNCGKTTLFNALTGARQRVGNWAGVTVERKEGVCHKKFKVVDLPGTYSLMVASMQLSQDERIANDYIHAQHGRVIVNIIDASNIERNLYLTLQLLEMGAPVVVALNMMDMVRKKGLRIDIQQLEQHLGCPVVPIEMNRKRGLEQLKAAIIQRAEKTEPVCVPFAYPATIERSLDAIIATFTPTIDRLYARSTAVRLLENDVLASASASAITRDEVRLRQEVIYQGLDEEVDVLIADARYAYITDLIAACVCKNAQRQHRATQVLDNVLLNRFLGIPIFVVVMYCMFLFAINIGGAFQDLFDQVSDVLFVQAPAHYLVLWHAPGWVVALVAQGVGKGINTVLTFIPVIGAMFLFLSFLEHSGYMSRAAFVVDRLMRAIGLPGKSFVPMIVGFGCNVPAVLATRTLENKRDRILTVLMSPFMSCGARLAIFAVFTAAFFPEGGQNIVFALYIIGITVAILTGLILRKTLLKGEPAPFVLELPMYHLPSFKSMLMLTWHRLRNFIFKAGKLIIPICVLLGFLNAWSVGGGLTDGSAQSLLSVVGRALTPIFSPMGLDRDNWPATVGLLSGVLAKEVVVGTLNTLYAQGLHLGQYVTDFQLWPGLQSALFTVPHNIMHLGESLLHPMAGGVPAHDLSQGAMGQMYTRFDGKRGAFSYLLFVLLYFPCVSTVAAMARELGKSWAWFSVAWTTGVAYGAAVVFYQLATFLAHPWTTLAWVVGIALSFVCVLLAMKYVAPDANSPPGNPSSGAGDDCLCQSARDYS
jgi:ferrous iron transport protein B